MSLPVWKEILPAPPPGAQLHEAWLTSFDAPDAGLLVEHLLPSLLATNNSFTQKLEDRTLFFAELGIALESLHGRLTVISSPPRADRKDAPYPWLWRFLDHFTVGADARAVQHAKLWAFHWELDDKELLELHISSTNLTTSAFKQQLQAGWRVSLPLGPRDTQRSRRTWGRLVPFLEALATSAGELAAARLGRLVALLGRVDCPEGVTFLASVPGDQSAARQLGHFEASELHVLTPTVGEWNLESVAAWCTDVGVPASKVHLKWIAQNHPWAQAAGWQLSTAAYQALVAHGVRLECLPSDARLADEHLAGDDRWPHAKLYLVRSGRKRRLLVTSANFSLAAWGAGKRAPLNFELGVAFEADWRALEDLGEPFSQPDTVPFCVDRVEDEPLDSPLQWAEATWDGEQIRLRARSSDAAPIHSAITISGGSEERITLDAGAAHLEWADPKRPPLAARFTQGDASIKVAVVDVRPPTEITKTPLPEVDPDVEIALREAFLLQRYGGPVVDADSIRGLVDARQRAGAGAPPADYSVQAWLDARAAFEVVDHWLAARTAAETDPMLRARVRADGVELRALYSRRAGAAAALVAEELGWRLDEDE